MKLFVCTFGPEGPNNRAMSPGGPYNKVLIKLLIYYNYKCPPCKPIGPGNPVPPGTPLSP